jgi:class 3 adenylate cyclase
VTPPFWRPWVPRPVARALVDGADPRTLVWRGRAVVLFADVSGFTALGEALAERGPGGAELLHRSLVGAFTPLVRKVVRAGGWVAKFGGDAMTAVFEGEEALEAAAACALDLARGVERAALRPAAIPELAAHRLAIKIGLGEGELSWCLAGDPAHRLELLLWGEALERAVTAEHVAARGAVVTSALRATFEATAVPGGAYHLHHAPVRPPCPAPAPIVGDHPAGAAFLHPVVAARLLAGHARFVQEHRRVVVLFVRFEVDRTDLDGLRARVDTLVEATRQAGGHLDKVDLGDKGSTALIVFGAPVGHEDDAERALRLACALQGAIGVAAGLHTGLVHAGAFGSPERHEYTVLGDTVNLAARLMQAAGPVGTILASREVVGSLADRLDTGPPIALQVKGRRAQVVAVVVHGFRRPVWQRERPALPMVGRVTELAAALVAVRAAAGGRGRTLVVAGEAGMGKSRFVEDVLRAAEAAGLRVSGGAAQPLAQEPWDTWREVWQALLPWSPDEDPALVRQRVRAVEPSLEVRAPLLSGPLGAALPIPPALEGLGDEARLRATTDLLTRVLEAAARQQPRVLVLEDAHWMDPQSRSLLLSLTAVVPWLPVLLIVATRPDDRALLRELTQRPGVELVALGPLSEDESATLVRRQLDGRGPPATTLAGITERAGGNPLFLDEIVRLVRARTTDPADPRSWEGLEVPRTLGALVSSRLDALADVDRLAVLAASVIGPRFRLASLHACCPELGEAARLELRLAHLAQLDLTPVDDPAEPSFRFRHALTRETAYHLLTDETRRDLHGRVAWSLAGEEDPDPIAVAWHFGKTDDRDQQGPWFRRAAAAATERNDPAAALVWFEQWLSLGHADGRAAVLEAMGRLAFRAGTLPRAEAWWTEARALADAGGDVVVGVAARVGLASLWADTGRRREAETAATEALAAADHADLRTADHVSALLFLAQLQRDTDQSGATALALRGFALAEALQEPGFAGRAAAVVALVLLRQPDDVPKAQPWLTRARELAEAADDPIGLARALSHQAAAHWWTGRVLEATAAWGRAVQEHLRIGDVGQAWTGYGNLAQVHLNRRSVVTARPMQALRCDHDTRAGRWKVAAAGLPSLLQTAYFHPDLWQPAADEAALYVAIAAEAGTPYWHAIALASAVLVWWRTGQDTLALEAARATLQLPPGTLVDEAQGWAACWGQLAGRRLGAWSAEDDARVASAAAKAGPRTRGFFAAAQVIAGTDADASLRALDAACLDPGDVFLHAIREALWGRPMDPPPALDAPPDLGVAPQYPELFAAVRERWARHRTTG